MARTTRTARAARTGRTGGPSAALAAALTLLLLAGCRVPREAGFPDVRRLLADRGLGRVHWRQGTPEDAAADRLVQELLGRPLTAAAAVEVALLNNPRLQATYERLGVAQADVVQAGLVRNPSLSGVIDFSRGVPPANVPVVWEFGLVQEFLDIFLLPLRKKFARAEFERVKLEVSDAVLETAAEVRTAFYTLQATLQIAELRSTVLAAAEASAELAARQHEAGNMSELDLSNEQALYAQAKVDAARAQAETVLARERLIRLLGVFGRDIDFPVAGRLPEIPRDEAPLERLETYAIQHRFDLAAERQQLAIVERALKVTRVSRVFPSIELGGDVHTEAEGYRLLGPTFRFELPIFDQGQARVARLVAEYRQARRTLEAHAIEVRSMVREARLRVLATRAVADYYRTTLVPLRERIVALGQRYYNAMLYSPYLLLQAKQNEVNAYREYIESVRDYWIARSDLERVIGGPIPGAPPPGAAPRPEAQAPPPPPSSTPSPPHPSHGETTP
ncbi:MAG TPA: TolC family protein [Polyangia bacterium]|nr:TolC family protein [Polyangia bacterium]